MDRAGFQLRREKCAFGYAEFEFLGHLISHQGKRPIPSTTLRISQFPRPNCKKEIRQFLGMVNWYREYIPRMADIAKPLNELAKKDAEWYWNDQCESAYQKLRKRLLREPGRLSFPTWDKPFVVESDASGIATGAVLSLGILL